MGEFTWPIAKQHTSRGVVSASLMRNTRCAFGRTSEAPIQVVFEDECRRAEGCYENTTLVCEVPETAAGQQVQVGIATNTLHFVPVFPDGSYTYYAPPVITSLAPPGGPVLGGTVVSVHGSGFDAGGVYWPHAVQKQVYALLVSQLVLAAVLALNLNLFPMLGVLALMTVTYVRAKSLAAYFGPLAADLPLSACMELDAELWRDAERRGELEADSDGRDGVLLPRALRRLLEEAAAGFAPAEGRGEHE